jgi:hypothetical protein
MQTLRRNTAKRWSMVTHLSMAGALVVCLMFAVPGTQKWAHSQQQAHRPYGCLPFRSLGFLTFGTGSCENILNNYDAADPAIVFMRVMYVFTMAFTFPVSFFVVR